jgi:hypothetical protein
MNRTLTRPMFRMGGSAEGITSGLQAPRQNYVEAGDVQKIEDQRSLINTLAPRQPRQDRSMSNFLIDFGLDIASRSPSGSIFSTAAASAKEPFAKFQQAKQREQAYGMSETSEDRALITELVKGLSDDEMGKIRQEATEGYEAGLFPSVDEGVQLLLKQKLYGVLAEPGELEQEGIQSRADSILAEKDVLGNSVVGYDTAIKIAEAVQPIYKGEVEGITAADIDTDQLYIDKDVMAEASTDEETGTLTFPTEIDQDLLDDYIEGMVYYNYRNGQFYRKSGKQFIPIQQPES